ncbi:coagulation factor V isoform X1 [Crotalus tigris]|uniref:coagulation factor V isoform X1 n=1 Tax=Crotalus tigris TaxID=88082 RepID=UPI00192FB064|nr:coagulation factor V isoform X1 [Crotalus tigris]
MRRYSVSPVPKCLLLMFLGWMGLKYCQVNAAQLREYRIGAQLEDWDYNFQPEGLSRLSESDLAFKKIVYREYEVDFKQEKPRDELSGLLGPTLRGEVGDILIIYFKNFATQPVNIHPQSAVYNKWSEGSSYSDGTSGMERLDDAVPPGQSFKYVWNITAEIGPKEADPPCLTYAYYSHVNMVRDFNSGLIGALLICKEGSLNANGTQKLFNREYVLMFAVFDESKNWYKKSSLQYTINGYANGTLPDVQACAYDHISWHLIGMSSGPEIFSVHFNGQTLEQNHYKVSTINLVGGASVTANMSVSRTGKWLISSLVAKHQQAGMHGYLNIKDCGNPDTLTRRLSFREQRMIKNWDYFIAAEEITWDYAPEIPSSIDRRYKAQYLDNFSNFIGKKYKKAVFRQYKDSSFSKPTYTTWPKERGILGPVIRAEVRDTINIVFKNLATRPYSIYVHGVSVSKDSEGAIYPSDSKENRTQGKAVQPGEVYTYKWTVLDTDEPTAKDSQCITKLYHSAVDMTRDIASGLIGPLLVCKRKALDSKGVQTKADVEQHAVFSVFDENKSWYLEDNIKKYCSNSSAVKRDDPKFYKSNVMYTLNGYASDRTDPLGFRQSETVEWHLISVGTMDEIVPVHLSGHTFLFKEKHQDILNLFPMSGESATVTMDNLGTWLLSSWGSREMSNGMRLRFLDANYDDGDEQEEEDNDDIVANVVNFGSSEVPVIKKKEKDQRSVVSDTETDDIAKEFGFFDGEDNQEESSKEQEEDYEEQLMIASMLGLRSFNGSVAEEEELNLTALAIQEDAYTSGNVSLNSHLVSTKSCDTLHDNEELRTQNNSCVTASETIYANYTSSAGEILISNVTAVIGILLSKKSQNEENITHISDSYKQMLAAEYLKTGRGLQSKDIEDLMSLEIISSMKEQEENTFEKDIWDKKRERQVLTEATLHALKEMYALLFYVQQKRNISAFNITSEDTKFLSSTENDSTLDNSKANYFSYDYDYKEEEIVAANVEFSKVTTNITSADKETVENNRSKPNLVSIPSIMPQSENLTSDATLDNFVSTAISKTTKIQKSSSHQRKKCLPKNTDMEWNVVHKKESDNITNEADNKFHNSSRNASFYQENAMFPCKRKEKTYNYDGQAELGQPGINNKYEAQKDENCTVNISRPFLKVQRKKKKPNVLTPRTSKPLVLPGNLNNSQLSNKPNHTNLLNEAKLTQKHNKPIVTIGLPVENGDYQEYDIDNIDNDKSSSGSFEYELMYYDNPYTTDSRLDSNSARNADDIAGRYLRTINRGNIRKYYIAAEEVLWDYSPFRKSTVRNRVTRTTFKKAIFRSYLDDTFQTPRTGGEYEEQLGLLGPLIRAEMDDVIQIQFRNKASRPYSLHAHGLLYEKSSEGRSYDDQSPEFFKKDDAIMPNGTYTYVWHVTKRSGPTDKKQICKSWAYYSGVYPEKDIHSGLIGPILICQKGTIDKYNRPIDIREFVLLFMVFDEERSWYFEKSDKRTRAEKLVGIQSRHTFPAINGISYQLQGLKMYKDENVHWHLLNMGVPKDIHVVHFHGQTFTEEGREDNQLGVLPLLPGSFTTIKMKPSKIGTWLLETEVGEYQEKGMQALFTVIDKDCKLPMGLASGIIQDSQISASGHVGYWEPKLARLNKAGKYNAWSIIKKENEHPWIQVDLQRQVVITGVQTQGAMQLLKSLYTVEYFVTYSKDGQKWIAFKGKHPKTQMLFEGNSDGTKVKDNHIDPPIIARYIRLHPTKFYNRPTFRIELLGCEVEGCSMPLGMESGAIKNSEITASSYKKTWWSSWEPSLARLNLKGRTNAWQPKVNNKDQWLQIDLQQLTKITSIITQGATSMSTEMYVKTFSIHYTDGNSTWKPYLDVCTSMEKVFTGNINSDGQVKHFFKPPILSRFIRIIPKTWNQYIALRIELFGCDVF